MNPTDRRYSKEHEWVLIEDDGRAVVGITHYAQDQLGDVVYVDLPDAGASVEQFQKLGEIESVKAVSDLFSPLSGEVVESNKELENRPELVNEDPFSGGWMVRMTGIDQAQLDNLLSAEDYERYLSELE